jgi:hypothetical protein
VNWKGYKRKQLWPNFEVLFCCMSEGTDENLSQLCMLQSRFKPAVSPIQMRIVTAWVNPWLINNISISIIYLIVDFTVKISNWMSMWLRGLSTSSDSPLSKMIACGPDSQGFTASVNINVNIHTNHYSLNSCRTHWAFCYCLVLIIQATRAWSWTVLSLRKRTVASLDVLSGW